MTDSWVLWIAVYERDKEFLLSIAQRILQNRAQAEDCLHDTMIDLVTNKEAIEKIRNSTAKSFRAYAIKAVQNHALRQLAEMNRLHEIDLDKCLSLACETDLEIETVNKESQQSFWHTWNKLDLDTKRILYLKYYLEISNQDIGHYLGIQASSVRMYLTRARREASKVFRADGFHLETD